MTSLDSSFPFSLHAVLRCHRWLKYWVCPSLLSSDVSFGLSRSAAFADVTDSELDDLIRDVVAGNDQLGGVSVHAQLRAEGIRVQRRRVRESLRRINPQAASIRAMSHRFERRSYWVPGPNSLWHIDGNHKLIRWRIVIHGGIDGYSRLVVFLRASNNNRSVTVLEGFLTAVARFGIPAAVRTDRGGENNDLCLLMNVFRGSRRSALRGASVHNQRIERLWGDLWRGVVNVYSNLFKFLESEELLSVDNDLHLWALHYVYLPRLNRDLKMFAEQWNHHGLRTERHQSPLQLFVSGCLGQQGQQTTAIQELVSSRASVFGRHTGSTQDMGTHTDNTSRSRDSISSGMTDQTDAAAMVPNVDWHEGVEVPQNSHTPSNEQVQHLTVHFDPLGGPRGHLAIEIYQGVKSYLESFNQH